MTILYLLYAAGVPGAGEVRGRKVRGSKASCRVPAAPPVWMWRSEAGVPGADEVRGRKVRGCKANCRVPAAPHVWMWRPEAGVPGADEARRDEG